MWLLMVLASKTWGQGEMKDNILKWVSGPL